MAPMRYGFEKGLVVKSESASESALTALSISMTTRMLSEIVEAARASSKMAQPFSKEAH